MAYSFAKWYPAESCTGKARDGAKALMSFILDNEKSAKNWGIYNCRNVRGGSSYSPHAEGRAVDIGMPMSSGKGSDVGHRLVQMLGKAGKDLGIQAIIYDRTIWSARSPDGRPYTGANPHYDHVHVEMTRHAANKVTRATVRSVMGKAAGGRYEPYARNVTAGERTIGNFETRPASAGDDVKELQRILNAWYPKLQPLAKDGYFGPKTEARVKYLQKKARIAIDGVVGPQTWKALKVR